MSTNDNQHSADSREPRLEARHSTPPDAVVVERRPVAYSPASATQLNYDRLPPPEETRDMSLAFRADEDESLRRTLLSASVAWVPMGLLFLILATLSLTRLVPFKYTAGLAGLVTLVLLVIPTIARTLDARTILRAFALPIGAGALAYLVTSLIHNRMLVTAVLAAVTAVLFWRWGKSPIRFYQGWIAADPRLRPETRQRMLSEPVPPPTYWVVGAALAIAIVVPRLSTTLAMVLIVAVCVTACLRRGRGQLQHRHALDALGHLLSYGARDIGAPGVWRPEVGCSTRRRQYMLLVASTLFAFGVGLSLFYPWDVARGAFTRALTIDVPSQPLIRAGFDRPSAPVEWDDLPPWLPGESRRVTPGERSVGSSVYDAPPGRRQAQESQDLRRREALNGAAARDNKDRAEFGSERASRFISTEIGDRPYTWFFASVAAVLSGKLLFLWWLPAAFLIALVLPNLLLFAVYHDALISLANLRKAVEDEEHNDTTESRPPWQWYVDRMAQSQHRASDPIMNGAPVYEANHLFMGVEPHARLPVLLDRSLLNQHCYIVGQTGSGKTSLGLMPMLIQLLRQGFDPSSGEPPGDPKSERNEPPIIIIDLKGDPAFFHTAMHEAEERRRRHGITRRNDPRYAFRFFTPEPGRDSYSFNPFKSMDSAHRSPSQLCELILDSLSLSHGEGYGRSYYTRRNRAMLYEALDHESKPRSFEDLYGVLKEMLKQGGSDGVKFDVFELMATVQSLERYKSLATDDSELPEASTIHFPSAIENRQVIYFWLPAATESVSVREIGKLALYSLLSAAIDRQRDNGEPREIVLMIDEFQRIAAENFRIILEQARSFGIRAILANQSISDLVLTDTDLRPTVRTNTRVKLYFSVSDVNELGELSESSGEEIVMSRSYSEGFREDGGWGLTSISESETLKPRLLKSDIIRSSDHPLEYILHVSQGSGYTQFGGVPIPVQTRWPISAKIYGDRMRTPWPKIEQTKTIIPKVQEESPSQIDRSAMAEFSRRRGPIAQEVYRELVKRMGQISPDEKIQ